MSGHIRENQLQITRPVGEQCRIDCLLDIHPDDISAFLRGRTPSLVMYPSRPAELGWCWPASQESDQGAGNDPHILFPLLDTGGAQISFSYSLEAAGEVDAFFPPGDNTYLANVELDPETGSIWFPLPDGRSLHLLDRPLGFEERTIAYFFEEWLHRRRDQSFFPSIKGLFTSDEEYIYVLYPPSAPDVLDDAVEWLDSEALMVPEALLQDPIRNGSPNPWHGFNPWNDEQKAKIIAHLELQPSELPGLFREDASGIPNCPTST